MNALLQQLIEHARGLWRFRFVAMITAWVVCLLGWIAVLVVPDTYEASARVFVDTRTTLSQVTQGIAVDSNVETQLQRVRQALLGGPQLEKVAREADLLSGATTPQERQGVVSKLRDRIEITGSLARDAAQTGLYVISYQSGDRDRSLRVVDRLLNNFVESTLGGKREGSEQAQRFLTDQISEYEKRLSSAESRLADFKKQNVGLMPGAQGDYFTRLQTEMDAVNKAQAALGIAVRKRDELVRQLRGEQPVLAGAPTTRPAAGGGAVGAEGGDTAARIRESQARLDELLLRFTDKHPDVIALRQTLDDLRARQESEIAALKRGDAGAAGRLGMAANPVYQSIQLARNQAEVDIASLQAEVSDHQRKIAELRKLVDTAPEVEAEYARLNRDYDVTRAQYQTLVERLDRARISDRADQTGIVTFQTIDPPTAAFSPVAPDRPKLMVVVLLAGLAAGVGIAYLLHQLKPVFSTAKQLSDITGFPVLGVVSMTWLDRHKLLERKGIFVYASVGCLLVAVAAVMVVIQADATRMVHALVH